MSNNQWPPSNMIYRSAIQLHKDFQMRFALNRPNGAPTNQPTGNALVTQRHRNACRFICAPPRIAPNGAPVNQPTGNARGPNAYAETADSGSTQGGRFPASSIHSILTDLSPPRRGSAVAITFVRRSPADGRLGPRSAHAAPVPLWFPRGVPSVAGRPRRAGFEPAHRAG